MDKISQFSARIIVFLKKYRICTTVALLAILLAFLSTIALNNPLKHEKSAGDQGSEEQETSPTKRKEKKTSEVLDLTKKALELNAKFARKGDSKDLDELSKLLDERKNLILADAKENQSGQLAMLFMPSDVRALFPSELQAKIEQDKTIKGTLTIIGATDVQDSGTIETNSYLIQTENKEVFSAISLDDISKLNLQSGASVELIGTEIGGVIYYNAENLTVNQIENDFAPTATDTTRKVAFVMFNFESQKVEPFDKTFLKEQFFSDRNSTNNYYKENSYAKMGFSGADNPDGDYFGWYTLSESNEVCSTEQYFDTLGTWRTKVNEKMAADGVMLDKYDHVLYIFPYNKNCNFSGMAVIGGNNSYYNGLMAYTPMVMAHELGHNLGLSHSGISLCFDPNGLQVPIGNDCDYGLLGESYDLMGGGYRHFSAFNKKKLGWLEDKNVQNVTASGSYKIAPVETKSDGVQLIKISTNSKGEKLPNDRSYLLDFRQTYGFDNYPADSQAVNSIAIRVNFGQSSDRWDTGETYFIDTNPSQSTIDPLGVGKTFVDESSGIVIKLISVSAENAIVDISFGEVPCVETQALNFVPIFLNITKLYATYAEGFMTYKIYIRNDDTRKCGSNKFKISYVIPSQWSGQLDRDTVELNPGEYTTVFLTVKPLEKSPPDMYDIFVTVTKEDQPSVYTTQKVYYLIYLQECLANPTPTVAIKPSSFTASSPGQPVDYRVTVTNNQDRACATYARQVMSGPVGHKVETLGLPPGWQASAHSLSYDNEDDEKLLREQGIIYIHAEASTSYTLTVTPPNDVKEGAYKFAVKSTGPDEFNNQSSQTDAYYALGRQYECKKQNHTVILSKKDVFQNRTDYYLNIKNNDSGYCGDSTYFAIAAMTNEWKIQTEPEKLTIKPGESGTIKVSLSPDLNVMPLTYKISFDVHNVDDRVTTLSDSYLIKSTVTCIKAIPTLSISPGRIENLEPGASASYTATVRNNNSSQCAATTYDLSNKTTSSLYFSFQSKNLTIASGQSASVVVAVTSSNYVYYNTGYIFDLTARDRLDPAYYDTANANYITKPQSSTPTVCTLGTATVKSSLQGGQTTFSPGEVVEVTTIVQSKDTGPCDPRTWTLYSTNFATSVGVYPGVSLSATSMTLMPQQSGVYTTRYAIPLDIPYGIGRLVSGIKKPDSAAVYASSTVIYYVDRPYYDPPDDGYVAPPDAACVRKTPTGTVADSTWDSLTAGTKNDWTINLGNNDTLGCGDSVFHFDTEVVILATGVVQQGWTITKNIPLNDVLLKPGQQIQVVVSITSPVTAAMLQYGAVFGIYNSNLSSYQSGGTNRSFSISRWNN